MIKVRKAGERGHLDHGWLDTCHTFSFGEYYDPAHMGFRQLRVINEDRVHPGKGFGTHPHNDMEILTYIVEGALEHADSMGNGSVIRRGDAQRMSAGTGILHSEFNPSSEELVHLLQIWILPEKRGLRPEYEQKFFSDEDKRNTLRLLASRDGRGGSVTMHQDAAVYASLLDAGRELVHEFGPDRHAWLQVVSGAVLVNGKKLAEGDGAAVSDEKTLAISAGRAAEFILFDLA